MAYANETIAARESQLTSLNSQLSIDNERLRDIRKRLEYIQRTLHGNVTAIKGSGDSQAPVAALPTTTIGLIDANRGVILEIEQLLNQID